MKNRLLRILLAVIVLSALALLLARWQASRGQPRPEVAIQDGKAIDFSSGKPVVKDTAKEKASIAQAVKEMDEAAQGVTFPSPKAAPKK